MPDSFKEARIVVCGCGPVGTLAALAAATRGLDVDVYDLRDDIRIASTTPLNFTRSINLALSERGVHAIEAAGDEDLLDAVLQQAIPMHARMIHGKDATGRPSQESQEYDAYGRSIKAVDRSELSKCLLDALERMPNVNIHFNHKLTGANFDKKKAWFEQLKNPISDAADARPTEIEVSFDFLIGADGAFSATRFHMMKFARLNYQQEYIDTLWCEFTIKAVDRTSTTSHSHSKTALGEGKFAISPSHLHIWPAGSFMFIAIPSLDGSFTCTLFASSTHFTSIASSPSQLLAPFFKRHFPGVCPDLISEADLIHQFESNPHLPLISLKCTPYHYQSSAVIIGDAAHAMVPFYGQGMNAGLEDVRVLFDTLDRHQAFDNLVDASEQSLRRSKALAEYTSHRTPDAHTINDLAMGNYAEMSSKVRSPVYKLRKWLEESVSLYLPSLGWRTQYTRVSFENQRYSEVAKEVRWQGQVLFIAMTCAPLGIGALTFMAWRLRKPGSV